MRGLTQPFNSLDPFPFWDRDLDRATAKLVEEECTEKLSADAWHLTVHTHDGATFAADLQATVENH